MHSSSTDRPSGARPWDRQPGETPAAWRAFCAYRDGVVDTGPHNERRSLTRTAQAIGHRNKRHLETWSSRWRWVARCEALDDHIRAEAQRQLEDEEIALETRARRARLTLRARRIDALLGDPDAVIVPDDAERDPYPDPRQRGLVDGLLDLIANPFIKGGPRIQAWKLIEEHSGLDAKPKDEADAADRDAVLGHLQTLVRALDPEDRPLFLALVRKAVVRLDGGDGD